MEKVTVEDVVSAMEQTLALWQPFIPEDGLNAIGPAVINGVIATLRQNKVAVSGEQGVLDLNTVAQQMQEKLDKDKKPEGEKGFALGEGGVGAGPPKPDQSLPGASTPRPDQSLPIPEAQPKK